MSRRVRTSRPGERKEAACGEPVSEQLGVKQTFAVASLSSVAALLGVTVVAGGMCPGQVPKLFLSSQGHTVVWLLKHVLCLWALSSVSRTRADSSSTVLRAQWARRL